MTLDQPRIVIGRGAAADRRRPSRGGSVPHAVVHVLGAEAWVVDEGSTHGTRVNGIPIPRGRKKVLHAGDVLTVGTYDIRVDIGPTAADPPERTGSVARRLLLGALASVGGSSAPPRLVLTTGKRPGTRWEVPPGRMVIGRGDDCDVVLDDPDCSRHHVEVMDEGDGIVLRDLGSMNGVFVAGRKVTERRLRNGDEVTLGRTTLRYEDPTEELLKAFDAGADDATPPPDTHAATARSPKVTPGVVTAPPGADGPVPEAKTLARAALRESPRTADWVVVALAVVILLVSISALWLVLHTGPGH